MLLSTFQYYFFTWFHLFILRQKKKKESHVSCFKTFSTNHKSSRRRMLTKEHIKHAVLYSPLLFFLSLLHLFFVLVECIFMVQFFFFSSSYVPPLSITILSLAIDHTRARERTSEWHFLTAEQPTISTLILLPSAWRQQRKDLYLSVSLFQIDWTHWCSHCPIDFANNGHMQNFWAANWDMIISSSLCCHYSKPF